MEEVDLSVSDEFFGMLAEQKNLDPESKEILDRACEAVRKALQDVEFFTAWEAIAFVSLEYAMESERRDHATENTPLIFIDPPTRA